MSKLSVLLGGIAHTLGAVVSSHPLGGTVNVRPPAPPAPGEPAPPPATLPKLPTGFSGADLPALTRILATLEQLRIDLDSGLSADGKALLHQAIEDHLPLAGLLAGPVEHIVDPIYDGMAGQAQAVIDSAFKAAEDRLSSLVSDFGSTLSGIIANHGASLGSLATSHGGSLEAAAQVVKNGLVAAASSHEGDLAKAVETIVAQVTAPAAPAPAAGAKPEGQSGAQAKK